MKKIKARVPMGNGVSTREIKLYSKEEAKKILSSKEWEIGNDIYSTEQTNKRIGWLASFDDGDGIYIEA